MTKHPMADIHMRLPLSTQQRLDEMAAEDAAPHKPDRGRWIADMIESTYARRPRVGEQWVIYGNKVTVHHLGRRPCGLVVFWEADEANYTEVEALLREGVCVALAPSKPRPPRVVVTPAGDTIEMNDPMPTCRHSTDPRVHIGKAASRRFYWAQEPLKVRKVCHEHMGDEIIEDEYGTRYTGGAFLNYIEDDEDILDSIGQRFS